MRGPVDDSVLQEEEYMRESLMTTDSHGYSDRDIREMSAFVLRRTYEAYAIYCEE